MPGGLNAGSDARAKNRNAGHDISCLFYCLFVHGHAAACLQCLLDEYDVMHHDLFHLGRSVLERV